MNVNFRFDGKLFEPAPEWSGYTHKSNLARIRQINPKWGSDIMTYIQTANSASMSYENYLKHATKVVYDETDDPLNFMIYGEGRRNVSLIDYEADDINRVGFNKSRFIMIFEAPFFSDVTLIVGMNDKYKVRIVSDPIQRGSYWAYECEVFGPSEKFIPANELTPNTTWSREGAPVPMTDSMKGAKTSYSSPYALTFDWSTVRIQDDVPGNMKHRPVAFAWKDDNNKKMYTWELYRTWKNDMFFEEMKGKTIVWGTSNMNSSGGYDDIDERSGIEIKAGPGIVQQLERGNIVHYNTFDIDEFGEHLLSLRIGKLASDKLHYVVSTGTRGMMQAHAAIAEKATGWEAVQTQAIFGDKENLGFGTKFTRYLHPGGFYIDFRLEPMLDDDSRTPVRHPNGGMARSYEYHVMDLGQTGGMDNVELHYVEGMSDNFATIEGFRSPFSPKGARVSYKASSAKDAWSEHRMSQFMVVNKNPKNSMIYRPNIQRDY